MSDPAPTPIAVIRKNSREEVRVALSTFRGSQFVDIRIYVEGRGPEPVPTQKGIALRPDLVPDLIEALRRAAEASPDER